MSDVEVPLERVMVLIQEVADSVAVLMEMAVFPALAFREMDEGGFPEHTRYLLALHALATEFGLGISRNRLDLSE